MYFSWGFVWRGIDCCGVCRYFETLSFLPPLSDTEIAKQVDYIVNNGWTPCLEFANPDKAYVNSENCIRFGAVSSVSTQTVWEKGFVCVTRMVGRVFAGGGWVGFCSTVDILGG